MRFLIRTTGIRLRRLRDWMMFQVGTRLGQFAKLFLMMTTPNVLLTFSRGVVALVLCALSASCINPLGPIGTGPQPPPPRSAPQLLQKFAWGISTSSYRYEDPAVKPDDKDYFYSDWDILIGQHKAPPKGNALYSWTQFEKDLAALKKIGVTPLSFQHFVAARRTKTGALQ